MYFKLNDPELCENLHLVWDQYKDMSWYLISFNTNTKTLVLFFVNIQDQ